MYHWPVKYTLSSVFSLSLQSLLWLLVFSMMRISILRIEWKDEKIRRAQKRKERRREERGKQQSGSDHPQMKCILSLSLLYVYVCPMCSLYFLPSFLPSLVSFLVHFFADFFLFFSRANQRLRIMMIQWMKRIDHEMKIDSQWKFGIRREKKSKEFHRREYRNSTLKRRHDGGVNSQICSPW